MCLLLVCLAIIGFILTFFLHAAHSRGINTLPGNSTTVPNPITAAAALIATHTAELSGVAVKGTTAVSPPIAVSGTILNTSNGSPT